MDKMGKYRVMSVEEKKGLTGIIKLLPWRFPFVWGFALRISSRRRAGSIFP
jgi:hypothetical protein